MNIETHTPKLQATPNKVKQDDGAPHACSTFDEYEFSRTLLAVAFAGRRKVHIVIWLCAKRPSGPVVNRRRG